MVGDVNVMEVPTPCRQVPKPLFLPLLHFRKRGVSKLTINCSLFFSLFHPLIQISRKKRLNEQINRTNNDAINGMFERPYFFFLLVAVLTSW